MSARASAARLRSPPEQVSGEDVPVRPKRWRNSSRRDSIRQCSRSSRGAGPDRVGVTATEGRARRSRLSRRLSAAGSCGSCSTSARRKPLRRTSSPASSGVWPASTASRVDLPVPLRPISPSRSPSRTVSCAPSSSGRSPKAICASRSVTRDIAALSHGPRAEGRRTVRFSRGADPQGGMDRAYEKDIFSVGIAIVPFLSLETEMRVRGHPDLHRRKLLKAAGITVALGLVPITARVAPADSPKLKIGIIGSGHVGSALGGVWARSGNQVMFSSRHLENDRKLAAEAGANARAGTPQEAAAFGQVLLFAVPYSAFPDLIRTLGDSIKGKVVINASNPFPQRDGEIANDARTKGAGLFDAQMLSGAHVVRAFNAVGAARMGSAHEDPGKIGMPIAGDDKKAIEVASRLVREAGFEPVLVGGLDMGKYLMPGTPLAGEHSPLEIRSIAATLKP